MKAFSIFVMANFILPLHSQSIASVNYSKQLNSAQARDVLSSYEVKENSAARYGSSNKGPVMNKEDEMVYAKLMATEAEKNKSTITAEFLSKLLAEGREGNKSLLVVKNVSECNVVLNISGSVQQKLPIPSNGQNAVLLPKGSYVLYGNVCELKYESQKDLNKNILVSIKRVED